MMAIDDLLDRARDARRRDEAAGAGALLRRSTAWRASGCSTRRSSASWGGCAIALAPASVRRAPERCRARELSLEAVLLVAGAAGWCGAGGWSWRSALSCWRSCCWRSCSASCRGRLRGRSRRGAGVPRARVLVRWLRAARVRRRVVAGVDGLRAAACRAPAGCRRSRRASWCACALARVVAGARRAARGGAGGVPAGARGPRRARSRQRGDRARSRWCAATRSRAWSSVPWPHRDAEALSLWEPIPVGVDELGETVTMSLPERNVLLGGEPGAGKSAALSVLVATAALDPSTRLWLLDGKLVELAAWAPCAQRLAGPDVDEAIALLRELREEMEARYRELLARGKRKITPRGRAAAAPGGVRRAGVLPRRRGPQEAARVRRAAARPGRPRPRGRRDRLRRDAEARVRRRADVRCGTCSGSGWRCGATRRRPRTRSSARAGPRSGTTRRRSRPGSAASGCCSPRTACRSACAAFTSTDGDVDELATRAAALRADGWLAIEEATA